MSQFAVIEEEPRAEADANDHPSVCFVCDTPGWAYDNISKNLCRELAPHFNCRIVYQTQIDFRFQMDAPADVWVFHHLSMIEKHPRSNALVKLSGMRCLEPYEYKQDRLTCLLKDRHVIAMNAELAGIAAQHTPHVYQIGNGLDLTAFCMKRLEACDDFTVGFCANLCKPYRIQYKGFSYVDVACEKLGIDINIPAFNAATGRAAITYDKMPAWYNRVSCLVHPSRGEGVSNTIMEALACECPVITTRVGFHGENLRDGHDVVFVERDVADVESAIAYLRENPSERDRFGRNGRQFAETHHDIQKIALLWKEAIEGVIASEAGN